MKNSTRLIICAILILILISIVAAFLIFIASKKKEHEIKALKENLTSTYKQEYFVEPGESIEGKFYSFDSYYNPLDEDAILSCLNFFNERQYEGPEFIKMSNELKAYPVDIDSEMQNIIIEFDDMRLPQAAQQVRRQIEYNYVEYNHDFIFDDESLIENAFAGYARRHYIYEFDGNEVINLGSYFTSSVEIGDKITDPYYFSNITDTIDINNALSLGEVDVYEIEKRINDKDWRIYKIEDLGFWCGVKNPSEYIRFYNFDSVETQIDYIYMHEEKMLVPILKYTFNAETSYYNNTEFSFWVWVL